jgi:hypothetical protein
VALRALRSPSKVAFIFLGNLAAQLLLAAILGLCLDAFGHQPHSASRTRRRCRRRSPSGS